MNETGLVQETGEVVKLTFKSIADMVQTVVNNYGTQAADVALTYLRVDAFFSSAFILLTGLGLLFVAKKILLSGLSKTDIVDAGSSKYGIFGFKFSCIFHNDRAPLAIISVAMFILGSIKIAMSIFSNPWAWVGMFMPELYAINLAIGAVK